MVYAFKTIAALGFGCVAATSSPTLANNEFAIESSVETPQTSADAHYEAAYSFAKIFKSETLILAESRYAFEGGLAQDLQADPDIAMMEADYPGITSHLLTELRSEIEKQVTDSIPELWESLAIVFSKNMTSEELAVANAYYSSPAGQRLIAATQENTDYARLGKAVVDNPDGSIKASDLRNSVRAGVGKTMAAMTAEDQSVLIAFSKTAAFEKIRELGPKVQEVSAAWVNQSSPEEDKRIEEIAIKVVTEFIEKADAENVRKS